VDGIFWKGMRQMGKAKSRKRVAREQAAVLKAMNAGLAARGYEVQGGAGPGNSRISDKLFELIRDDLYQDSDVEEARQVLCMAGIAWNLAVEPEVGEHQRQGLHNRLPPDVRNAANALIARLKERKLALFPRDLRLIIQTEVRLQSDGGFYFAASALGNEDGTGRHKKPG
jgi:hypothetical protein